MASSWYQDKGRRPVPIVNDDDDPVAMRQEKRAELRATRRQQHEDRAERRRVKDATTPAEPSLAAIAAEARATGQPAILPSAKHGGPSQHAHLPGCGRDLTTSVA